MSFWKTIGKVATTAVKVATPIAIVAVNPEAAINTAAGAFVKHGLKKVPTDSIPYLNILLSSGISFAKHVAAGVEPSQAILPALSEGGLLAGSSTLLHQSLKLPLRSAVKGSLAKKVGPGERFSL